MLNGSEIQFQASGLRGRTAHGLGARPRCPRVTTRKMAETGRGLEAGGQVPALQWQLFPSPTLSHWTPATSHSCSQDLPQHIAAQGWRTWAYLTWTPGGFGQVTEAPSSIFLSVELWGWPGLGSSGMVSASDGVRKFRPPLLTKVELLALQASLSQHQGPGPCRSLRWAREEP